MVRCMSETCSCNRVCMNTLSTQHFSRMRLTLNFNTFFALFYHLMTQDRIYNAHDIFTHSFPSRFNGLYFRLNSILNLFVFHEKKRKEKQSFSHNEQKSIIILSIQIYSYDENDFQNPINVVPHSNFPIVTKNLNKIMTFDAG